jgi:hypothetical protein
MPAREAVRRVHGDRAHAVVAEMLLDLADQRAGIATVDRDRIVDLGQVLREGGLDHDALDLLDTALVAGARFLGGPLDCAGFHIFLSPYRRRWAPAGDDRSQSVMAATSVRRYPK